MGGSICLTVRGPDGKVYRNDDCWTNGMNFFIDNIKIVNKDLVHLAKLTKNHREDSLCAPVEYGFVLVDMLRNKIYSCQSYSSFGKFFNVFSEKRGLYNNLVEFFKAGRLLFFSRHNGEPKKISSIEELNDLCRGRHFVSSDLGAVGRFVVDMAPFEVRDFDSMEDLYEEIKKLDLNLTQKDHDTWLEWIKPGEEDY